jgi:SpoVK/Ycf46/Vps4 family AAA+-type ATPase
MSSFNADKKREHESLAEKALSAGDYAKAFFHTTQAAEFTFILAEKSEGDVAKAYLEDANGLVEIAAGLKAKIPSTNRKASKESSGEDNSDASAKSKWTVSSVGDIRLDDVKGLVEAKAVVTDALINPVNHPDVYKELKVRPGTGLLLYGPPGTGKTMFAKAIANEMNTTFMHVKLNELKSKYVGDTEANISEMPIEFAPVVTKLYNAANCDALGITIPEGYEPLG